MDETGKNSSSRRKHKISKASQIAAAIAADPRPLVDAVFYAQLRQRFACVSESTLRKVLLACGRPLAPLVEGVRQDSFENLERTLTALEREYDSGGELLRREIRRLVIRAKDHADWAARRAREEDQRSTKEEMALWIRTWLENPALFESWVTLRKAAVSRATAIRSSRPQ